MSTPEPEGGGGSAGSGAPPVKADWKRNPWIWVSAVLGLVAIGLLIWGLNTKSDLDKANKDVAELQSKLKGGAVTGSAAAASYKSAYDDLQQQVGTTSEDLSTTENDLKKAEDAAAQADKEAAAAKKEADQAKSETDKADAETKQAQSEAKAAESKAEITTECAKAYVTTVGKLFESDDPSSQEAAVKKELETIAADCEKALAGG